MMSHRNTMPETGPIIEMGGVTKCFGSRVAVRKMSFNVQPGDVYGLVGENGAGKTTMIRLLLGLLEPTEGRVGLFGHPRTDLDFSSKCQIGFVLEANGIYDDLSVEDNLDFYSQIYRVVDRKKRIAELLDFVQLDSRPSDKARALSKGMRQKLAIARALLNDPQLLILDEPTSGLDPLFQKEIVRMITNWSRSGRTVLLSSHNLREVQEACTTVAFIVHGSMRIAEPVGTLLSRYKGVKKLLRFENVEEQVKAELLLGSENNAHLLATAQGLQFFAETKDAEDRIVARLLAHGIRPQQLEAMPVDLNDIFDLVV